LLADRKGGEGEQQFIQRRGDVRRSTSGDVGWSMSYSKGWWLGGVGVVASTEERRCQAVEI
jgi:hypothetical protein